jgi:tetratricopeptide (TPR) repeat protein
MGQLLGERGDIAAALDALERAVRLAPTSSKAMLAAADLLAGVGRGAEAIKFYQRATFCGPPIGATYARLGHCCVEQGLLLDAVVWLRTAIVLDPKQAACYRDLAQIYTRQGRTDVAQRYLDSAARLAGAEST